MLHEAKETEGDDSCISLLIMNNKHIEEEQEEQDDHGSGRGLHLLTTAAGKNKHMRLLSPQKESNNLPAMNQLQEEEDKAMKGHKVKGRGTTNSSTKGGGSGGRQILFLDGLRGLACMLVVISHAQFVHGIAPGKIGVDIFFVLSSFLLTFLFEKKVVAMQKQNATNKNYYYMLLDYFSKRILRIYPLFACLAILLAMVPDKVKAHYYDIPGNSFHLLEVLTFTNDNYWYLFWSLPVEIEYYFVLPFFVAACIYAKRKWWLLLLVTYTWIIYQGCTVRRTHHQPLSKHLSTFLAGSCTAILYTKIDSWMKNSEKTGFVLTKRHKIGLKAIGYFLCVYIYAICSKGLFFHWGIKNPFQGEGAPFISLPLCVLILIEMIQPSEISNFFEWNLWRAWGKVSFSAYLLHPWVIRTKFFQPTEYFFDHVFLSFTFTFLLATLTYHLIEKPAQRLAIKISQKISVKQTKATAKAGTVIVASTSTTATVV